MEELARSTPLSLDTKEMTGRPYQVLNTLYHLHVYLQQNGEQDGFDPTRHTIRWASGRKLLTQVDRWVLYNLQQAVVAVEGAYGEGRYNEACKELEHQIVEVVSQGYVRMVRNELWSDTPKEKARTAGHIRRHRTRRFPRSTCSCIPSPPTSPSTSTRRSSLGARLEEARSCSQELPPLSLPRSAKADSEAVDFALDGRGRMQLGEG